MIHRITRGGSIAIDTRTPAACVLCDGEKTVDSLGALEITTTAKGGRADTLAICGDCLATALALALARDHVRRGGQLEDISGSLGDVYGCDPGATNS